MGLLWLFLVELVIIYLIFSVLISNVINIYGNNPHKQKLLESSILF